jgi:hypothetical protein
MPDTNQTSTSSCISDTNLLVDRLSEKFDLTERQQEALVSEVSSSSETTGLPNRSSIIGLTTSVSTFVAQKNFHNFAVPQFASHWGVVCDFGPRARTLFHLLFNPVTGKVVYEGTLWKQEWSKHSVTYVGKTSYDYPKVVEIGINDFSKVHQTYQVGERLTEGFEQIGDYHVIFWNCQLFAKLLLKLICHEPEQINFDTWSTADVARLVCSFIFRLN